MLGVLVAVEDVDVHFAVAGAAFARRVFRVSVWDRARVGKVLIHLLKAWVEGRVEEAIGTAAHGATDLVIRRVCVALVWF